MTGSLCWSVVCILLLGVSSTARAEVDLAAWLEPHRQHFDLPALGAVVVSRDAVLALGVTGRRSVASDVPVHRDDAWHLGSITKSMTAFVAARLVQRGLIEFDTTVGAVLGSVFPNMHRRYRGVTLEQLLGHRGGLPENLTGLRVWQQIDVADDDPVLQRHALLTEVLRRAPGRRPGSAHVYSNAGYVLAATMLEARANRPWEALIAEELFSALGLASAGLGAPGRSGDAPEQPLGHRRGNGLEAMLPGPFADHPPALAPAGTVHMNLADLGRYLRLHLGSALDAEAVLHPNLLERLHEPLPGQNYALGWWREPLGNGPGYRVVHEGSNTFWFAVVWLLPVDGIALAAVTNRVPEDLDALERLAHDLLAAIEDGAFRQNGIEGSGSR